jgi:hypothetical protein
MARKSAGAFCILAVCLLIVSCTKLDTPSGPLRWKQVEFVDSIPAEYGSLVSVTSNPQNPAWVYLWFQKPDGTITVSFVNVVDGRVNDKSLSIPRK